MISPAFIFYPLKKLITTKKRPCMLLRTYACDYIVLALAYSKPPDHKTNMTRVATK